MSKSAFLQLETFVEKLFPFSREPFLPAAKPSGLRTVRVVVGGGGSSLTFGSLASLFSHPKFSSGWDSRLFDQIVAQKSYFSSGWDPSMACSFCCSVSTFFAIFFNLAILSVPQVLEQSLFLFPCRTIPIPPPPSGGRGVAPGEDGGRDPLPFWKRPLPKAEAEEDGEDSEEEEEEESGEEQQQHHYQQQQQQQPFPRADLLASGLRRPLPPPLPPLGHDSSGDQGDLKYQNAFSRKISIF